MKSKKAAPPRRRISFAVDREEIDISSDWVQAVMARPPASLPSPAPSPAGARLLDPEPAELGASPINNATDAENSAGTESAPVERCTSVENTASVVINPSVVQKSPVAQFATGEVIDRFIDNKAVYSAASPPRYGDPNLSTVANDAPVAKTATDKDSDPPSTEPHFAEIQRVSATRKSRPRPLHRITDGLTPGQYAVYNLMFEAGQPEPDGARLYRGGYADLCRLTGLSKRGIQNIVAELQDKHVIRIQQAPGYHRTETSVYHVPPAAAVLDSWRSLGLRFAAGKSKTLLPVEEAAKLLL